MRPVRDIARKLGCSQETIRRALRSGTIPGVKIGGVWRADPEKVVVALSNGYRDADASTNGTTPAGKRR